MTFSLTILGSSSALPTSERNLTAHSLNANERFFLIDCGEATQIQIRKNKLRFSRLDHIFISHLHGDHYLGLPGLLSTLDLLGRQNDLHIYAPEKLKSFIDFFLREFTNGFSYPLIFHPLHPKEKQKLFENKSIEIHSFPVKHSIQTNGFLFIEKERPRNIRKECIEKYGLGIEEIQAIKEGSDFFPSKGEIVPNKELTLDPPKSRSYAYCADTKYWKKIADYVKGVDLLYHEATYMEEERERASQRMHSTAKQAATIARDAGVKKLIIGHFSSRYKDLNPLLQEAREVFPETYLANDGVKFEI